MTDKKKREIKDGVVSIFKRFNILDHTSTIGNLRDDILRYIDSLQEEPVSDDLEEVAKEYEEKGRIDSVISRKRDFINGAKWQKQQMMKGAILIK